MKSTATTRQRIGAGLLAMLMLALFGAGLLAECPPGCCEAGELSIARKMECCEIPTMTERSPASSEAAITVRIAPQVFLPAFEVLPATSELEPSERPVYHGTAAPPRSDAPLFLLNAQFLI
jgi:hypothetical protein